MTTKEEYAALHDKWIKIIINAYYLGVLFICFVECIICAVMDTLHYTEVDSVIQYILTYIVLPTTLNFTTVFITSTIVHSSKIKNTYKDYSILIGLCIVCTVIATIHAYFLLISSIFVAPIVMSIIFNDIKSTRISALMATFFMLLSIGFSNLFDHTWPFNIRVMNSLASVAFIITIYIITSVIIKFANEKNAIIVKSIQKQTKLKEMLKTDFLTGLYNHSQFYSELEKSKNECNETNNVMSIVVIDVDNFKMVNDSYGHENGNVVLVKLSDILKKYCNSIGQSFRYGGEEFSVIFYAISAEQVLTIMENIRLELYNSRFDFMTDKHISISCGIYEYNNRNMTVQDIFKNADCAMYNAKSSGKNQCVIRK